MQIQSSKYNNNKDKGVSWLEDNIGDGAAGTGLFTKTKKNKEKKYNGSFLCLAFVQNIR